MSGAIGNHCDTANFTAYVTPWGPSVTINKALLPRFKAACEEASSHPWKPKRIDSYNCRQIRGSASWSRHAYAAAFDFFDKPYPQPVDVWGPTNSPPSSFAAIFEKYGFTWGGRWSRQDWPHIEWSGSTVPVLETKEWDEMASKQEIREVVDAANEASEKRIQKMLTEHRRLIAVGEDRAYEAKKTNLEALKK